jgi:Asp-tRNA(Asn)/Glu-tRNA(Gln) amidotransferase A subunit family amidase
VPNGFQLVGRPFDETTLLQLGVAYQRDVKPQIAPIG